MGLGGISIWQLLIVLVIIVLLFGTSKLRNLGGDVGAALKNFRDSMRSGEEEEAKPAEPAEPGRLPPNEAQKSASAETRAKERV